MLLEEVLTVISIPSNPSTLIALEHLSLYIQKHLGQSEVDNNGQQLATWAAMGNIELFCTYPIWKYSTVRTVLPLLGAVLRMNSDANGLEGRHETGIGGG